MSRPSRFAHFSYVGPARYSLTLCTYRRTPVFVDEQTVSMVLSQFRRTAGLEGFAILVYCFMPDHLHVLAEAMQETADLRRFVKMSKQRSGALYKQGTARRLWQEGYYDRVLREEQNITTVARYIIANPVRGGLVASAQEYPFIGSDRWALQELLEGIQQRRV